MQRTFIVSELSRNKLLESLARAVRSILHRSPWFPRFPSRGSDVVEDVLHSLGVESYHILAHDIGDTVAQELLARHCRDSLEADGTIVRAPHCPIRSAVLLNGGVLQGAYRPKLIQQLLAQPWIGWLSRPFLTRRIFHHSLASVFGLQTQPTTEELDQLWALTRYQDGERVIPLHLVYLRDREDSSQRWTEALTHSSTVDILFLNGPADPISGRHMAEAVARQVPGVDVTVLPDHVGHYPAWEAPEMVSRALAKFYRSRK